MHSVLSTNEHLLRAISSLSTREGYVADVDKSFSMVLQALDEEKKKLTDQGQAAQVQHVHQHCLTVV